MPEGSLTGGIGTITMHPGGTHQENEIVWRTVLDEARANPGKVITLNVSPGTYNLTGESVFVAGDPGVVIQVSMNPENGKLHVAFAGNKLPPFKYVTPGLMSGREEHGEGYLEKRFGPPPPGLATADEVFGKERKLSDERFTYNKPDMPSRESGSSI